LDQLPAEFLHYLDNVEILVEDWAPLSLLKEMEVPDDEDLYGVSMELPDRIVLYQCPLEDDFPEPEELRREIATTVLHEIAHHFGIDEYRLEELGWG